MNEFYNKLKYFEDVEAVPAKIYYHYTSLEALHSIVTSRTFRLTNLKSSNDKKELYYGAKEFLADLANACANERDVTAKKWLELVEDSIKTNSDNFFAYCKEKSSPYALCLSEKKDSLTHWDRYAFGCTGVAIGFNVASLQVYTQRMTLPVFDSGLYEIGKVFYSSESKEVHIRNALVGFISLLLKENGLKSSTDIQENIRKNGYLYAVATCKRLIQFSKDSSFIDEDEIRLHHDATAIKSTLSLINSIVREDNLELFANLKNNFMACVDQLRLRNEGFCVTKSGIRSYREFCLEELWGSGAIPEIILGPMCVQNRIELKRFLKANGLEGTKVSVSKVPIR